MSTPLMKAAQEALDVQNACNLSGVVFAFARNMQIVCDVANQEGHGTSWKNHHPIAVLFANKIGDMTGQNDYGDRSMEIFGKAYDACEQLAKGEPMEVIANG